MNHLFELGEAVTDVVLPTLSPIQGLRLLAETALPLTPETRLLASIALHAGKEFGPNAEVGAEIAGWGSWPHTRVRSLVAQIAPPSGIDPATDALLGSLAGITLYGLLDAVNWPPERQRAALDTTFDVLGLAGDWPRDTSESD